jgi:hypothetical protein
MRGWIKLHRSIEENDFYFEERFTKAQAWIDLLVLATYKPRAVWIRGIEISLKPGELCYSQLSLAKRWRWNRKTVMSFLKFLEEGEMIHTKSDNVTTVISIKNWKKHQSNGGETDTKTDTRTDTNKKVKNVKKHPPLTPPSENDDEVVFKNEFFSITKNTLEQFRQAYPLIEKLQPEVARITDILKEKTRKGEAITTPMGFLHAHLKKRNEQERQKAAQHMHSCESPRGVGPVPIAEVLHGIQDDRH